MAALLAAAASATAQSNNPRGELGVPNGPVYAIVRTPSTIYIGGTFTRVGPYTGAFAAIDASSGAASSTIPKVKGVVLASAPDGAGGWYIGGSFTSVGGIARNNLARILANGTLDQAWNPNADATVRALAVSGNTVYTGGSFIRIGGQERARIAALDAATGAPTAWNPNSNWNNSESYAGVYALAVSGNTVYVGGYFVNMGGQRRNHIAALDATTGASTIWNPNAYLNGDDDHRVRVRMSGVVVALAVYGNTVYAGGSFTRIGGQERARIVALDAITGAATAWNPGANREVRTLLVDGNTVYAGGLFYSIGGQSRNRIAALDAATGAATAWNPMGTNYGTNTAGEVFALAGFGNTVYAGGNFTGIGGQGRNFIAALDTATGAATAWNPNADGEVRSLAVSGNMVYAGGLFTSMGGQQRNNIAALDTATGTVTAWNPNASWNGGNPNTAVRALAVSGNTVYVGGDFNHIGGQSRNRIAAVDVITAAPTAWNPDANGNSVYALAVSGNTVYAGGDFANIGGQERNRIAALDAATGAATAWNPNAYREDFSLPTRVLALAITGNTVYVGGLFTRIGGQERNRLAALDAATGTPTAWNPDANGNYVSALAISGSTVYAGGAFTRIGGQERKSIAALDAATGTATAWNPNVNPGSNYDVSVISLAVSGNMVYAGGDFTGIGGQERNGLAALDAATGTATAWNPNPNGTVRALAVSGDTVYAGGAFESIGLHGRSFLAEFPLTGEGEGEEDPEGEGGGEDNAATIAQNLLDDFDVLDTDNDGRLSVAEAATQGVSQTTFTGLDANGDGFLTRAELIAAGAVEVPATGCGCAGTKASIEKILGDLLLFSASAIILLAFGAVGRTSRMD